MKTKKAKKKEIQIGKILNNESLYVNMKYDGEDRKLKLNCPFDARNFSKDEVLQWYKEMNLGRKLDDKAALYVKMAKGWSYHAPFGGHDGIQLALGKIFRKKKDYLFPYYRDMMTVLSAGLSVEEIMLNGLSKEADIAGGGRHMSNHFAKTEWNIQNVSSCTGNHAQHAVGLARAIKKYGDDAVVYYSGGESASSEGYFWEALNVATLEKLPVVFVIQNNKYGISVPVYEQTANSRISDNYIGFKNMKIFNPNGRCPFNSYNNLMEARDWVLEGNGAAIVQADCDRIGAHSNSDPHRLYRDDEELDQARERDPMLQLRYTILQQGFASEEELQELEKENQELIWKTADKVEAMPDADGTQWNEFLMPDSYDIENKLVEKEVKESEDKITYLEGINQTMKQEFRRNPNTYLWGQDVASKDKGGIFNVNKGMLQEFGNDRIFNAPIAENSIVGTANGFSRYRDDIRVVVEGAEFADYFWPAMDQLVECSHDFWRTKGQFAPNVTIRLASGGYIQGGLYHSQNLEAVFTSIPGIRVVQPAFAEDAVGLMRNSLRSRGTTMFLEPKFLYNFKNASGSVPDEDHVVPFGKAKVRREGTDISIIGYGTAVHMALLAAEKLEKEGISVEVVDLRSLIPWDRELVYESIKKTNRALIAHEDKLQGGFGGEIASAISKECFEFLDAPVDRVGSKDVPVGFAKNYETETLLNIEDIVESVRKIVRY